MSDNNDHKEQRLGLWVAGSAAALSVLVILFYAVYGWETGKIEGSPTYGQAASASQADTSGVEVVASEAASLAVAPASNPAEIVVEEANKQSAAEMTAAVGANAIAENGIVKFYFATGQADLAPNTEEVLQSILAGVQAGKKAIISGYNDSRGSDALNAELSKQRAFAVRNALLGFGVPENQIELREPQSTEAGQGNDAQARRVEVFLE